MIFGPLGADPAKSQWHITKICSAREDQNGETMLESLVCHLTIAMKMLRPMSKAKVGQRLSITDVGNKALLRKISMYKVFLIAFLSILKVR